MKKFTIMLFALTMLISSNLWAQGVAINNTGTDPDNSAMLDVSSVTAGILIPRLSSAQRNAITVPATGLLIFQTDNTSGFYYYTGASWSLIGTEAFAIDDLADGRTSGNSIFLGEDAGANDNGTVNRNVGVGNSVLNANTSGVCNTAVGHLTLSRNISGFLNTAVGRTALYNNTTGDCNTAFGNGANYLNEEGSNNTIIGCQAGNGTIIHNKSGNVFLGNRAGYSEMTNNKLYIENSDTIAPLIYGEFDNNLVRINGDFDVTGSFLDIGIDDLLDGRTTGNNVYLGLDAGANDDSTNNQNVGVGRVALNANTSGHHNNATGYYALFSNISGNYNTAYGFNALLNNTTGNYNTAYGNATNLFNQEGSNNTMIGYQAGRGTILHNKSGNVFLGYRAGYNDTTDNKLYIENSGSTSPLIYGEFDNDIIRFNAKRIEIRNTGQNIFIGDSTGVMNSGSRNMFIGDKAGYSNTSGSDNIFIGDSTGFTLTTGNYNLFMGNWAGQLSTTGNSNVILGIAAGQANLDGYLNVMVGTTSGWSNTSGYENTFLGTSAGGYNTTGSCNTFIGRKAGLDNQEGDSSIFIGYYAGAQETTSHKLYIDNSDTIAPLIYGEFDNNILAVNGSLGVGTMSPSEKLDVSGNAKADTVFAEAFSSNSPLLLQTNGITRIFVDDATGNTGIGTNTPDGSALLEINSNSKGFLIPRMTSSEISAIYGPADGLQVYNTDNGKMYIYVAIAEVWKQLSYGVGTLTVDCPSAITDSRDGQTYNTVKIGSQCWMAKNLAYLPSVYPSNSGSYTTPYYYVYGYEGTDVTAAKATSNYQTYGVLYNWPAAMDGQASSNSVPSGVKGICPLGWHLPSDEEWKILEGEVDSQYGYPDPEWNGIHERGTDAGGNLKETGTTHWDSPNTGATNNSGFSALPAGYFRHDSYHFTSLGNTTKFWSSTMNYSSTAWYRTLYYTMAGVSRDDTFRNNGFSVRCIKD